MSSIISLVPFGTIVSLILDLLLKVLGIITLVLLIRYLLRKS